MSDRDQLRRSQGLLARLFRNSPAAIALVRLADGVVLDMNESYQRLFGWRREEVVGTSAEALRVWVHAEERARFRELISSKGRVVDFESKARRKDGTEFDSLMSAETVDDAGERMALLIVNDVSSRKRADKALRDSESRYRTLAATMGEGILILQEGRFKYANLKALELVGYPFEELHGREFTPFIHPEDRALVIERHRRRSAGEALEPRYDIRILPRSGEPRWVQIVNEMMEWEGKPAVLTVISDISERKRAEDAIRESEQRFRALVELSSDWYWVTDAEHRFTFRDGEILRRMGIPPQDDYGRRRWEMHFPNMSEADWAAHRARLERREEFRDLLLERQSPDGRVHWATISGRPLFDAQGKFVGYHGTGRDVTEQIHAERRLRRFNVELEKKVDERTEALDAANRELEAFAYSVSHDLRAPLRAIDGFAGLVDAQAGKALGAEAREYLLKVRGSVARMNRMIDDLLAFSYAARAELKKVTLDLSALARSVVSDFEVGNPGRRVEWAIDDGIRVHADPGLLRIVLQNLLGNAWKYTSKSSAAKIEVRGADAGGFSVRDNGVGFDQAMVGYLFKPFQRLHGAHDFEGSGVGLATVSRIVVRHGGRVDAEGAPGCGAVFRVQLPLGETSRPG